MARGQEEGSNRKRSRKDQILELYKNMDKGEVRELSKQLEDCSDRELRSEVHFSIFYATWKKYVFRQANRYRKTENKCI